MLPTFDAGETRIAVAFPSFAERLPLVRLGRQGLVFRARGAMPPVCGLPRSATLYLDDEPLCTLRLVIREVERCDDGAHDLTMQPSAANGDALLWHALRTRCRHARAPLAPRAPDERPAPATQASARRRDTAPRADAARPESGAPRAAGTGVRMTRSAAFRLADRGDALFFADWLEYHFDELRALAQGLSPRLHLNELERDLAGDKVDVRFVYDIDGHADRRMLTDCARQACDWIATEVRRRFDLRIAEQRFGARKPRRATRAIRFRRNNSGRT
ncbi:Hydroxymethylglutaryl-coenzyme A reductase [Burkholderia pseudomallei]|uniref:hydroxymethylglutaryl-coenzyme A reductase n=1 Tax=Burkholderia pseudomallei TaxID=28450 RepID=UPI000F075854|nr:hydroxymethylglutaryl-coenzyme A reductase [Burkholderia pseudomallei]MBF3556410.1 hydroxymethylglutaryl-coenzyme A reductase [Burkholderia pseudomallei]MDY7815854.1 hydroxymethylglutaryl-coenzyme A reductase [Burkholderia pseudomallei]MDY7861382.1 hydroxymethylglutaryl-coenzyme A reductase [Burkholderia pseudomallei]CAJ2953638.1 Hydroxymethylglutaryl-coenzyme A reductase [Burkholderia pseudomallei]VCA63239.1 Hydroxymethylglutaryl-coenzyme A reductase [Burkholderia pseudomallei]